MNVYIEKQDSFATLTTWIFCAFHQMYAAENMGLAPYIHWPVHSCLGAYKDPVMYSKTPNMYDWYFEQPFVKEPPSRDKVWTWESPAWGDNVDTSKHQLMSEPLAVIKDYYKKHLTFNNETNKRGMQLVEKYGIDFSKTIGLSWRGTDIYLDGRPRIPIEVYFPFIDEILQWGDFRIMCTAEENLVLRPLLKRYSQAFIVDEFESSPYNSPHNPERLSKRSGYERGLQPALMVWLFSKCAHYIKNRSSTGGVASWISNGRIISIFHPENLGFPANTKTVEIEGRLYTEDNKLIL